MFIADPIDKDHGHILGRDMRIIKNNSLKKLTGQGPKYRESKAVDFTSTKNNFVECIGKCIRS